MGFCSDFVLQNLRKIRECKTESETESLGFEANQILTLLAKGVACEDYELV